MGFLVGSIDTPGVDLMIDGFQLQNGADGIAIHREAVESFPNGTFVTEDNLVDAVVYGTSDPDAFGLLDVLTPDKIQVDEGEGNNTTAAARVPDGGLPFNSESYVAQPPSPGRSNEVTDTIQATAVPSSIAESSGTNVTLTLSRTGPTDRTVVINIAIDDPTELTGPGSATFTEGQANTTVALHPLTTSGQTVTKRSLFPSLQKMEVSKARRQPSPLPTTAPTPSNCSLTKFTPPSIPMSATPTKMVRWQRWDSMNSSSW